MSETNRLQAYGWIFAKHSIKEIETFIFFIRMTCVLWYTKSRCESGSHTGTSVSIGLNCKSQNNIYFIWLL